MHLEFTYEFTDAAEASRAQEGTARSGSGLAWVVGVTLFVVLAALLIFLLDASPSKSGANAPPAAPAPAPVPVRSFLAGLVIPLIPWVVVFGLIWFFLSR